MIQHSSILQNVQKILFQWVKKKHILKPQIIMKCSCHSVTSSSCKIKQLLSFSFTWSLYVLPWRMQFPVMFSVVWDPCSVTSALHLGIFLDSFVCSLGCVRQSSTGKMIIDFRLWIAPWVSYCCKKQQLVLTCSTSLGQMSFLVVRKNRSNFEKKFFQDIIFLLAVFNIMHRYHKIQLKWAES